MPRNNQGRGRGRGRSRGGRNQGRGRGRSTRTSSTASAPGEKIVKFSPQTTGRDKFATYATVTEAAIGQIQRTYDEPVDICKALTDMQHIDLNVDKPTRTLSALPAGDATEIAARQLEQDGLDIEYKLLYQNWLACKKQYDTNQHKSYALIFEHYCTKVMKARVEEHPDFKTKIKEDPIALLEAIKSLMQEAIRAQYPWISAVNCLVAWLTCTMYDHESPLEYNKCAKQLYDVAKAQWGSQITDLIMKNDPKYLAATNATQEAAVLKQGFETLGSYILIRGAHPIKYKSLHTMLTLQFALGNTEIYPTTLTEALDVLANHKIDPAWNEYLKKQRDDKKRSEEAKRARETEWAESFCPASTDAHLLLLWCKRTFVYQVQQAGWDPRRWMVHQQSPSPAPRGRSQHCYS